MYRPETHPGNCVTVGRLIEILQALDPGLPVTGYRGDEFTGFVSEDSIRVHEATGDRGGDLHNGDGSPFVGRYVDIMGD